MKKKLAIGVICKENISELKRTLLSIISQTENNFELLIVDGSKIPLIQKSSLIKKLIHQLNDKKTLVNYLIQEKKGISNAFNCALKNASSDYIIYLNSGDEFFSSETLKKLIPYLIDRKKMYCFASLLYNPFNYSTKLQRPSKKRFDIYYKNPFPHSGVIIQTEILKNIGGFNEELNQCMDYELFIRLILKYKIKPKFLNLIVSIFYGGGISSNLASLRIGLEKAWQVHKEEDYFPNILLRLFFQFRITLFSLVFNRKS